MRHLKYFKESIDDVSLKNKLKSILNRYNYIWENNIDADDFIGGVYSIFGGCLDFSKKPFKLNIDCLLKSKISSVKLLEIEKLYDISILPNFRQTKDEIEKILEPILKSKFLLSYTIKPFYRNYKIPSFSITLELNDELLTVDRNELKSMNKIDNKTEIEMLNDDFYSYQRLFRKKLNDLNLTDYKFEMYDSTTFGNYFQIRIILEQINNN